MRTNKDRLNDMFKALRKEGYIARQNFMCCGGCASAALGDALDKAALDGKPKKGAVYYHRQDAERMDEGVYLGFGAADVDGLPATEEAEDAVGIAIIKAAYGQDLAVVWNGKHTTRIWVALPGGPAADPDVVLREAAGSMVGKRR
jgi:hypothetical protein